MYTYPYANIYIYTVQGADVIITTDSRRCVHAARRKNVSMNIYICMHKYIYVCIYIHMYTYIHIYIHMYI